MTDLNREKCKAGRTGAPKVEGDELQALLREVPDWSVESRDGIMQLERRYAFPDFDQALVFTDRVGELAESEGHHPRRTTEWGSVTVTWWIHKIT